VNALELRPKFLYGAGKTTCFNLLTKFLAPTAGTILFNGVDRTCAWRCRGSSAREK
jgi:ABC-type branched-subunit amino acid transport system ATPase component